MSRPAARWFARHDGGAHLATGADAAAAWRTGQSSLRHSRLSPAQDGLLDDVERVGYRVIRAGLPYRTTSVGAPYRPEPTDPAAARNAAVARIAREHLR